MSETLVSVMYVAARYLHLVASAILVGGTLFYLWVVPAAIDDLKDPSRQAVFARARWIFRRIVFGSAIVLILGGALLAARSMWIYRGQQLPILRAALQMARPKQMNSQMFDHPGIWDRPALWFIAHTVAGLVSILVAVALVRRMTPPKSPLPWMRLNFTLLLIVILFASLTRNARQRLFEQLRPSTTSLPFANHE